MATLTVLGRAQASVQPDEATPALTFESVHVVSVEARSGASVSVTFQVEPQ